MFQKCFCAILITISLTNCQTIFPNACANNSLIPLLATGTINLNIFDNYNNGANKDYYQDLSAANFNRVDVLGYAFALAGFQGPGGQTQYTLGVDVVEFQNQNTRMRIVVNFKSKLRNIITDWRYVTLTYLVVSRSLNGAYSDIWATVAEIMVCKNVIDNQGIDDVGLAFKEGPGNNNDCEIYIDPYLTVNIKECQPKAASNEFDGGLPIIHAYIMGFQWNANISSQFFLGVSVLNGNTQSADPETDWTINYTNNWPNGPAVTINNFGGALEWIKVGFVYSRMDFFAAPSGSYPQNSRLLYSSSYIFQQVTQLNTAIPITNQAPNYNIHYYVLPDARYAIYGLSSFILPKGNNMGCAQIYINATLDSINTFTVISNNYSPTQIIFQADIFTLNIQNLCASTNPSIPSVIEIDQVAKKAFFTVPTQSIDQYILEDVTDGPGTPGLTTSNSAIYMKYVTNSNGNSDNIIMRSQVLFVGIPYGAPIEIQFRFFQLLSTMAPNTVFSFLVQVNNFTIYQTNYISSPSIQNVGDLIMKGLNLNSTTADVTVTVSFQRSTTVQQQYFYTLVAVSTFFAAYDPSTGCCVRACEPNTGLDVNQPPATCVTCNIAAGLYYSPANNNCTCISGYYLQPGKISQCYPCAALFCVTCDPNNSTLCYNCVVGAILNANTLTCSCSNSFFINGTVCQQCPVGCQACSSPTGTCFSCVDFRHRDINQNCQCITGYFDTGTPNCSACSANCLSCTNSFTCVSCDASKFRNLTGTVCSCLNGYFQMLFDNKTKSCKKCNPECMTCQISSTFCTSCDVSKNRVGGSDQSGYQTCLCLPGFYSTPDGSCIQTNCNADPFCSQCEQGLQLCVQCLASKQRILKLPESICVCQHGYYQDSHKICQPCPSGCEICANSTSCTTCVPLASPKSNGSCSCPLQTYFQISSDGIRYCSACFKYCLTCTSAYNCTQCFTNYIKTVYNRCLCPIQYFIDSNGSCLPCPSGCQICNSSISCTECLSPFFLQGIACQASCSEKFTALGSVCYSCPEGCLECSQKFNCLTCTAGAFLYNGQCCQICPAGTIGDSSNGQCASCNSPCLTCIGHPSFCTSCEIGKGYLQNQAIIQSCVETCPDGTFQSNGACHVCYFSCQTCLGSASNCISCPDGQMLYQGACLSDCPAILIPSYKGGLCLNSCPDGFYNFSVSQCDSCSPQCLTCSNGPDNCTSCLQGSLSISGTCLTNCTQNQFDFAGVCIQCDSSCTGCQFNPTNCIECAPGYVQSGSICQKECLTSQYFDSSLQRCIYCNSSCRSCSLQNYCITCASPQIKPREGVCSNCPYPCATCDSNGNCNSCLSGFYYFQQQCQISCPQGLIESGGICECPSGIISNGECVPSCSLGYINIAGTCQSCNPLCAQCSEAPKICTVCLQGYYLDNQTQSCISPCQYGHQITQNGYCSSICSIDYLYFEGTCLYGECFPGYTDNGAQACIRDHKTIQPNTDIQCPSNYFILSDTCVAGCGTGYFTSGQICVACANNCLSCVSQNYCVQCSMGYQSYNGICNQFEICNASQFSYGFSCVSTCPLGTSVIGGICTRICPSSTYNLNSYCYTTCPTIFRTADACVQQCPLGLSPQGQICQ